MSLRPVALDRNEAIRLAHSKLFRSLVLPWLADFIGLITITAEGTLSPDYTDYEFNHICETDTFRACLTISVTITVIALIYIPTHFNLRVLDALSRGVVQGMLSAAIPFVGLISYQISFCNESSKEDSTNFHLVYNLISQTHICSGLMTLGVLKPQYFSVIEVAIFAWLSCFNQITNFIHKNYSNSALISASVISFNGYFLLFVMKAIYNGSKSFKTDPNFKMDRRMFALAMANLILAALGIWVVAFAYGSLDWEDTNANSATGYIYIFLAIICSFFFLLNYMVFHDRSTLSLEQSIRMDLLNRILPPTVTDKLLQKERPEAESFDSVTILFSDIKGFTDISSRCPPGLVMNMLNDLYVIMDYCCKLLDLYKVETIGDAYMIASGITDGRDGADGAVAIANFAILVSYCCQFVLSPVDGSPIQLRLGAHSGPVTAGVVGDLMPRYCLFGDTVNVASRMESNSEAMRIHISETTATLLQSRGLHELESRGFISIKGKGLMNTFWLTKNMLRENTHLTPQLLESTCQTIQTMRHGTITFSTFSTKKSVKVLLIEDSPVVRKISLRKLEMLSRELAQKWIITSVASPEEAIKLIRDYTHLLNDKKTAHFDNGTGLHTNVSSHALDLIFTSHRFHGSSSAYTGAELIVFLIQEKLIDPSRTLTIGMTDEPLHAREMLSSGMKWVWEKPFPPIAILVSRIKSDAMNISHDIQREARQLMRKSQVSRRPFLNTSIISEVVEAMKILASVDAETSVSRRKKNAYGASTAVSPTKLGRVAIDECSQSSQSFSRSFEDESSVGEPSAVMSSIYSSSSRKIIMFSESAALGI